ncbi:MAG: hypothetical protein BRD31_00505 [Bacteroidetes bacterium QH_2_64_26]|nr:MAG: hypothetical protein BRD31_00505 [Bacteroidetes bacterium QH_2_64_26]
MSELPDPFDAATRRIQAARLCLDKDFPGVAVAETYYAMMDLIRGALRRKDIQAKTHSGLETLFFKQFVDGGPISRDTHQTFVHTYEARWRWHYRFVEPNRETVERYLDTAMRLLDALGT